MATTDKNTLKSWFKRGAKPLASQFAAWIDSFWHKDESIPIGSITNLSTILGNKIDRSEIENITSKLSLERKIPLSLFNGTPFEMFIGEELTLYNIISDNVKTLTINGQNVALDSNISYEVPAKTILTFFIETTLTDSAGYLYVLGRAKAK